MFPRPFGKYLLERELAHGGMARVFLATLRGTDGFEKQLVVKQIRDELAYDEAFVARFVTEAKTAVRLNHPNIVPVFELGVDQGTYFIAMELVRGVSVAEYLRTYEFDALEGAYLGAELCKALEYAHRSAGIIHRDITPRNVMIDEEGQIKVIDFGIAAKALAASEGIFGSPGHMPPEQLRGEPLTPRSDIFAAGVLLLECWSGKPPFRRATPEACEAALAEPPPKPSNAREDLAPLDAIIADAVALEASARPESAEELGRALRRYLQTTDTMDIARRLGGRVAELRTKGDTPASEVSPHTAAVTSEKRASHTQTFATRSLPEVETLATRPLETPAQPATRPRAAFAPYVLGGLFLIPAFYIAYAYRFGTHETSQPQHTASLTSESTAPSRSPQRASAEPAPVPTPSASAPVSSASVPKLPTAVPAPTGSHANVPPSSSSAAATLTLVCDPGTIAFIDGARTVCPGRGLVVSKGAHELRFNFEPTGESRSARVTFAEGDTVTVRADFAAAVPQVLVSRP